MKDKYILYKDTESVGHFEGLRDAAAFVGCSVQNIHQNKRGVGCYIWRDYMLIKANTWEAEALLNYKRLARHITNPAHAWTVYSELKKLLVRLEGEEL